jgi:hypothetical protein
MMCNAGVPGEHTDEAAMDWAAEKIDAQAAEIEQLKKEIEGLKENKNDKAM